MAGAKEKGGPFFVEDIFGRYLFTNSNLEGGTFFVELCYKLNTNPPLVIINEQSLKMQNSLQ